MDIKKSRQIKEYKMLKESILNNLSNLNINYFEKDIRLNYTGCNDSTAEYAGLDSPQQILNKSDYDLIWRDSSAESFRTTDHEVISGKPQINHLESIEVAGGMKDFLITKTTLLDDNDKVVGIIGCNICVSGFTLAKKEGYFNLEEQRLYLGKAFGDQNLTTRQLQVFKCILHAFTTPEIALYLKISTVTVRSTIRDLKNKLQCRSKAEIVLIAIKNGWTFFINEKVSLPKNIGATS
jgi:DNA-binding CsgD family transcriptional regulator